MLLKTIRERNHRPPHQADKPLGLQRSPHTPQPSPSPSPAPAPGPSPAQAQAQAQPQPSTEPGQALPSPAPRTASPRTRGCDCVPPAAPLRARTLPAKAPVQTVRQARACPAGSPHAAGRCSEGEAQGAGTLAVRPRNAEDSLPARRGGADRAFLPLRAQLPSREVSAGGAAGAAAGRPLAASARPPSPPGRGETDAVRAGARLESGQVRAQLLQGEASPAPCFPPPAVNGERVARGPGTPELPGHGHLLWPRVPPLPVEGSVPSLPSRASQPAFARRDRKSVV